MRLDSVGQPATLIASRSCSLTRSIRPDLRLEVMDVLS